MITKQELEKLKELAGKFLNEAMKVFDMNNHAIIEEAEKRYNYAANPDTVLRLIEALEVATEALWVIGECVGDIKCYLENTEKQTAQEALNKIYGVE